ncbi:unnamed protein product, partial [Prorocentrum cordatum]
MAAPGGAGAPRGDLCAACCAGPLDDAVERSLVLVCGHRLCVVCAASLLEAGAGTGSIARCPHDGSVTPVRAEAAQQQRKAPRPTPVPAAGNSSSSSNGLFDVVRLAVATQRGAQDDSRRGPAPPQHWGAAEVWPAPSPLRCGQCQEVVAEVACESCHEEFCHWCSAVVHRAGRMRSHQLVPLTGALPGSSGDRALQLAGGLPPSGVAGAARPPVTCQAHPGVAARFFCLDCERDCICAECALNPAGEHRGHRVESARDALVKLDPQIRELLQAGRADSQDAARAEGVQ